MNMFKGVRLTIVLIVLLVGLGVFLGGQYVVKTYHLEEPFKAKVLSMEGIESVELTETDKSMKVRLTLNSDVRLQEVYQTVNELANEMLNQKITIEMDQQISQELEDLYQEMHFAIYEGIASGKFTMMSTQLKEIATTEQVDDYQIQVDNNNVYLKVVADGEVFSKIIPRQSERLVYMNSEGGESQW